MTPEFNLLDEPWIRVMDEGCTIAEVSLTEALIHAHRYAALAGESPAQDVAILRLLIAVAHTVFYRVDEAGQPSALQDEDDALDRWTALRESGRFPEEPVRAYLKTWRERFYLFHETRPFYQVPEAAIGTAHTAAKLNGAILQSDNKMRIFAGRTTETSALLSFAEAARWLVNIQSFDDASVKPKTEAGKRNVHDKPGSPRGWMSNLGVIYAIGETLFETILLNLVYLRDDGGLYAEPKPCWELDSARTGEYSHIPVPDNIPALFTLQSRRILLKRDGEAVKGFAGYCGDLLDKRDAFGEPMTIWYQVKEKKTVYYSPQPHSASRQLWRDFASIAVQRDNNLHPGIVYWLMKLQEEDCLEEDRLLRFAAVSALYDPKGSSVTDVVSDSLSFHADLLTNAGHTWQVRIENEIQLTDKSAGALAVLAGSLAIAAGKREIDRKKAVPAEKMQPAETAKTQYYHRIDGAFRKWLLQPAAGQNADEVDALCMSWRETAVRIARELGRELVEAAGPAALIGRWVETERKGAKVQWHYSSAEAFNTFNKKLNRLKKEGV